MQCPLTTLVQQQLLFNINALASHWNANSRFIFLKIQINFYNWNKNDKVYVCVCVRERDRENVSSMYSDRSLHLHNSTFYISIHNKMHLSCSTKQNKTKIEKKINYHICSSLLFCVMPYGKRQTISINLVL